VWNELTPGEWKLLDRMSHLLKWGIELVGFHGYIYPQLPYCRILSTDNKPAFWNPETCVGFVATCQRVRRRHHDAEIFAAKTGMLWLRIKA
jgi:hypothetical protein